jgi:hypothetical protein
MMRILLAEDNEMVQEMMVDALEMLRGDTGDNGIEAIAKISCNQRVLMYMSMLKMMDGIWRGVEDFAPGIPILAVSAGRWGRIRHRRCDGCQQTGSTGDFDRKSKGDDRRGAVAMLRFFRSALPFLWLILAFLLLFLAARDEALLPFALLVAGAGVVIGVIFVRQVLALRENQRLTGRLEQELAERMNTLQALQASETRYRAVADLIGLRVQRYLHPDGGMELGGLPGRCRIYAGRHQGAAAGKPGARKTEGSTTRESTFQRETDISEYRYRKNQRVMADGLRAQRVDEFSRRADAGWAEISRRAIEGFCTAQNFSDRRCWWRATAASGPRQTCIAADIFTDRGAAVVLMIPEGERAAL